MTPVTPRTNSEHPRSTRRTIGPIPWSEEKAAFCDLGPTGSDHQRAERSIGKRGGEVPTWIVPSTSKPCRS
jgi:hypothetical protein